MAEELNVRARRWIVLAAITAVVPLVAATARAQDYKTYTRATFDEWMRKTANAKPDFKPGDVLTAKDIDRIRPFVLPGYLEQLNFPEFKMEIAEAASHAPDKRYLECTEKYQSQVKLQSNGAVENYICGLPFPNSSITESDPQAGIKAAWNFNYHWANFGLNGVDVIWIWDRFGGSHQGSAPTAIEWPPQNWTQGLNYTSKLPSNVSGDYAGGGTFQRVLNAYYQRVNFTHLAQYAEKGGVLPIPGAEEFEFKEFTGFFSPFDIRGTAFIIFRYADPTRAEDSWAYVPNLRRVRRVSAEVKSDSLLGTDMVLDDFYGFAGRPLEWNWKFLGWRDVLGVMDSKYDGLHLYGPNGTIPDDQWSLRKCAIYERIPKDTRYPYSSAIMVVDADSWFANYHFAFDRKGKLWKTNHWQWKYTEAVKNFAETNHGVHSMTFGGVVTADLQNDRATIIGGYGFGYPNLNIEQVTRLYDINKLEEIHR